VVQGVLVV